MAAGVVGSDAISVYPISLSPWVGSNLFTGVAVVVQPVLVLATLVATTELAAGLVGSDTVSVGPVSLSPGVGGDVCASVAVAVQPGLILTFGLLRLWSLRDKRTTTEVAAGLVGSDTV